MFHSLRFRLTFTFLLLSSIPVIVVSYIVAQSGITSLIEQEIANQQLIAERVETEIDTELRESEKELNTLIDILAPTTLNQQEVGQLLQNIFAKRTTYNDIAFLDAEGQEEVRHSRFSTVLELGDRSSEPEFTEVIESGEVYYSPIYFSETLREPLITLSIPIENLATGNIENVLVAELRFKPIWDLIAATEIDEFSTVYVMDQSGRVIAHRNPSIVLSNTTTQLPEADGISTGLADSDVIIASQQTQFGDQLLTIVAEHDLANAFEDVRNTRDLAFIITAAVLALVAILIYVFVGRVVRPIEQLSKTAALIQEGNLRLRASETRSDEIGELAASFNSMTDQLANSIDTLEERVQERTADLVAAKDEAQRANNAKTSFLANTSHELRTPLNAVINYTKLIASGHWGNVTPEQDEALTTISKSGRYLLNLINDLLDMSKMVSGSLEIYKSSVDLNDEVTEVIKIANGLIETDDVKLITDIDPDLPELYSDGVRIRQIMINMVSNACKFTKEGHVRLVATTNDDGFQFKVEDTGTGIKPGDYEAVFAEFQQTESGLMQGKGTGLGMSLSKSLAEAHDGDLWFESTYGEGTTFYLDLPLTTKSEAVQAD